jgi:hypothetical protein
LGKNIDFGRKLHVNYFVEVLVEPEVGPRASKRTRSQGLFRHCRLGVLTKTFLLTKKIAQDTVEFDRRLVEQRREKYAEKKRLAIAQAYVLLRLKL